MTLRVQKHMPELDLGARMEFLSTVLDALKQSRAFARADRWPHACIVWSDSGIVVRDRGGFAGWLRANDLHGLARGVLARRLFDMQTLIYVDCDASHVSGVAIFSIDIARELQDCSAALKEQRRVIAQHVAEREKLAQSIARERAELLESIERNRREPEKAER